MENLGLGVFIGIFLTLLVSLTLAAVSVDGSEKACGFSYGIEKCENSKLVYYPNGYHLEVVKD